MLRLAVLVSGGGTNLQAILDAIDEGTITNAEVSVVISNNAGAYALERAKKKEIDAVCLSPKTFASREAFNEALLAKLQSYNVDLVVLAGCLVVIPQSIVDAYPNKIINIHPSLIPSFCGTGYYGLKVHEGDTPKALQQRVMEEAEWVIMPRAIDLIANGKVMVEDGHVKIKE